MKFIVDEMPFDYVYCPFCKEEWNEKWIHTCSLTDWDCNLYEKEEECDGLKRMKGTDNEPKDEPQTVVTIGTPSHEFKLKNGQTGNEPMLTIGADYWHTNAEDEPQTERSER